MRRWWAIPYWRRRLPDDEDFAAELRFHLEGRIDELVAAGMTRDEARQEVLRNFGDPGRIARECHEIATPQKLPKASGDIMESFLIDLRHTFRQLVKNPGFTAAAILTLALGIGANTSMFSIANATRMVSQRFERPDSLVFLWTTAPRWNSGSSNMLDVIDWRRQAESFEQVGVFRRADRIFIGEGEPETIRTLQASANLLAMLGLEARVGRLANASEEAPDAERVVVLTNAFWERKFGGQADVLGRTVKLDDVAHTIIGVLPAGLEFDRLWRDAAAFTVLPPPSAATTRASYGTMSIARLKDGVTVGQAQAEMDGIAAGLAEAYPETNAERTAVVQPLDDYFLSPADKITWGAILIAVGVVLMIACINLANLLLARAASRGGEFAVRVALGAGRVRIIRQLLTESLLLAVVGGALGLLMSRWVVAAFLSSSAFLSFQPHEIGVNAAVLTYTVLLTVGSAVVFGLAPALAASSISAGTAMKDRGASAGRLRTRFGSGIVVAQVALTLPLLIACAMAARQLVFLESLDLGFEQQNLLVMQADAPTYRYESPEQWAQYFRDALDRIEATPGVEAAGATLSFPLGANRRMGYDGEVTAEGRLGEDPRLGDAGAYQVVTPGFFRAMGVPIIRGRAFTERDRADAQQVAIVNQRMADHYWPDDDAVGRRFTFDTTASPVRWVTVVGVVGDVGADFWGETAATTFYMSHAQRPHSEMQLVVRTADSPLEAIPALRDAVHSLDPEAPLYAFRTVDEVIDTWLNEDRIITTMIGSMGLLALGLASIGLFGTIAYSVAERTREIGVRVALGARRSAIMNLVIRRSLRMVTIGTLIGSVLSVGVGIALMSLMYGAEAPRPLTVVGALALLFAVALVAAYVPARRATRIDPLAALRAE